jgi:hypothetical protein
LNLFMEGVKIKIMAEQGREIGSLTIKGYRGNPSFRRLETLLGVLG